MSCDIEFTIWIVCLCCHFSKSFYVRFGIAKCLMSRNIFHKNNYQENTNQDYINENDTNNFGQANSLIGLHNQFEDYSYKTFCISGIYV